VLGASVRALDDGGWRYVGRQQGQRNRSATVARSRRHGPLVRRGHVHTVIDDHSRVAYAEV